MLKNSSANLISLINKFQIKNKVLLLIHHICFKIEDMRNQYYLLALLLIFLTLGIKAQTPKSNPTLFDFDWRFHRGGAQSAETMTFDDSKWRKIDLPHDWSIEDLPGTASPFNRDAISQSNGGFTTGGTGWYRKSFTIPVDQKGKKVLIQFDGVYMNAEVWLNGRSLGNHPYGYTTFWFDITDRINFGQNNVIAVKVRNEGENSRWYSGSGIYRHVWLDIRNPIHIAHWGTAITTPVIKSDLAKVNLKTKVLNETKQSASIRILTRILTPKGIEATRTENQQTLEAGATFEFNQDAEVKSPERWSIETPSLYSAITEIYQNSALLDSKETTFGIRTISFDVSNGFRLNGVSIKLKGGCVHHDNGPLGAKAFDRAEERRIEILKASGYNAVRTSHNPPSPAFLDACDRLGMLVMDEAFDHWRDGKNPEDYHLYFDKWWQKDVASMVDRDRNHPSIIMWSIGNEIPNKERPEVVQVAKMLSDYIHQLDSTRPVTSAVDNLKPDKDPYFATLDIGGYNYATSGDHTQGSLFEKDHLRVPERIMLGTESFPLIAFQTWMDVIDQPYVLGDFVWTAFDYIGEASIGWRGHPQEQNFYPWNLAYCGDIDICGWKRAASFYRDALWKENQVSIFVAPPKPSFEVNQNRASWSKWYFFDVVDDWNWQGNEGKLMDVNIYSSCEQVELFLNDKSLGIKPTNRSTKFMTVWQVPYTKGKLKAVGYSNNKQVNVSILQTADKPSIIKLSSDRTQIKADGQDLIYITVELTDAGGILNPTAENLIKFKVEGPGTIVAVGNANPISTESYELPQRKAWRGRCLVIIKSTGIPGDIILKASTVGLKETQLTTPSK
jgi:beta-galactosidase